MVRITTRKCGLSNCSLYYDRLLRNALNTNFTNTISLCHVQWIKAKAFHLRNRLVHFKPLPISKAKYCLKITSIYNTIFKGKGKKLEVYVKRSENKQSILAFWIKFVLDPWDRSPSRCTIKVVYNFFHLNWPSKQKYAVWNLS